MKKKKIKISTVLFLISLVLAVIWCFYPHEIVFYLSLATGEVAAGIFIINYFINLGERINNPDPPVDTINYNYDRSRYSDSSDTSFQYAYSDSSYDHDKKLRDKEFLEKLIDYAWANGISEDELEELYK